MKDVVLRAHRLLVAISLATLLALVLTLAAPVAAQEETTTQTTSEQTQAVTKDKDASGESKQSVQGSGQQADGSSCSTGAGEVATFTTKDDSFGPFRITGRSFEVLYEARADRESGSFKVVVTEDGETVTETGEITVLPVDDVLKVEDEGPGNFSLEVEAIGGVDFAITVCEAGKTGDGGGGDDLKDLSCDELLVLFRSESSSGQQYGDTSGFANSEVRAQVEVCLEREIVQGTAADEDLPDTGGLSLTGLAVLGVVSSAAGLSVIRGGRR